MLTRSAVMHADVDQQQNRPLQIQVNGNAVSGTEAWRGLLTAVARSHSQKVSHLTDLAIGLIESRQGRDIL